MKETFQRKELKYLLDAPSLYRLREAVSRHLLPSEFGTSQVNSLYLDTRERSVIARSVEKPLYKEKLRIRWYRSGSLATASEAFVELKKKHKGIVYKRRLAVSPQTAIGFSRGSGLGGSQIAREIEAARQRMGDLLPSALVICRRTSFGSDGEGELRITFDEGLRVLDLFDGGQTVYPLEPGQVVLEVKGANAHPFWLVDALSAERAYPVAFSKYGAFYERVAARHASAGKEAHRA